MTLLDQRCQDRDFWPTEVGGQPTCYQCRQEMVQEEGQVCHVCEKLIDEQVGDIICRLEGFRRRRKKHRK